jgi:VWFA-related protein
MGTDTTDKIRHHSGCTLCTRDRSGRLPPPLEACLGPLDPRKTEPKSRIFRFPAKVIVLFSDGVDTESRLSDAGRILALAEQSGAAIYAIRYDTARDVVERHTTVRIGNTIQSLDTGRTNEAMIGPEGYRRAAQFLMKLPERTGGRIYQASDSGGLDEAFKRVGDELRRQNELSYYPANRARDGSYRRIEIRVDRPGAVVRARPGYRAVATHATSPN